MRAAASQIPRGCGRPRLYNCYRSRFPREANGELLDLAEGSFDVLFTIDRNIRHQQNLAGRELAILVVRALSNDIDDIRPHIPAALEALARIQKGQLVEVGGNG